MSSSANLTSTLVAQIVWATHILSYLAPSTFFIPTDDTAEDDEQAVPQQEADLDAATDELQVLTTDYEAIRRKFLNCIAELLSPSKGGPYVTATALREQNEFVEVDVARNSGFIADDASYLDLLTSFLAIGHTSGR